MIAGRTRCDLRRLQRQPERRQGHLRLQHAAVDPEGLLARPVAEVAHELDAVAFDRAFALASFGQPGSKVVVVQKLVERLQPGPPLCRAGGIGHRRQSHFAQASGLDDIDRCRHAVGGHAPRRELQRLVVATDRGDDLRRAPQRVLEWRQGVAQGSLALALCERADHPQRRLGSQSHHLDLQHPEVAVETVAKLSLSVLFERRLRAEVAEDAADPAHDAAERIPALRDARPEVRPGRDLACIADAILRDRVRQQAGAARSVAPGLDRGQQPLQCRQHLVAADRRRQAIGNEHAARIDPGPTFANRQLHAQAAPARWHAIGGTCELAGGRCDGIQRG